jgi:hypothetical protein
LKHDSPKGFIFITAGRDLRKIIAFPAFQSVLSAHRFRRSLTCGYENPAFQAIFRGGKQSHIIIYEVQILKFIPGFLTPHPSGLSNKNMFEYRHKNPEGMLFL